MGGIVGSVLGGLMIQYTHPKYSFLLYSVMGLVITTNGMYLTKSTEEDTPDEDELERAQYQDAIEDEE